uniref:Protein FYV12 n=1 Tax=Lygus hesperus TaxID=30085 RepID=A0A0A9XBB2_LYGHE
MCILSVVIHGSYVHPSLTSSIPNDNVHNDTDIIISYQFTMVMKLMEGRVVGIAIIETIHDDDHANLPYTVPGTETAGELSQRFYETVYTYGIASENVRTLIAKDATFDLQFMGDGEESFSGVHGYEKLYSQLRQYRKRAGLQAITNVSSEVCKPILTTATAVVTMCMIPATHADSANF